MPTTRVAPAHVQLQMLSKTDLHSLADGLLAPEPWIVDRCVEFVIAETDGHWHGRARAMMCRRLKHCDLGRTHRTQLLASILGRLDSGAFTEQFKDQLRLVIQLDLQRALETCRGAATSAKPHVRRYAQWVLAHEQNR